MDDLDLRVIQQMLGPVRFAELCKAIEVCAVAMRQLDDHWQTIREMLGVKADG